MHRKIYLTVLLDLVILALAAVVFLGVNRNDFQADFKGGNYQSFQVELSGQSRTIRLGFVENNGSKKALLTITDGFWRTEKIELSGFEDNIDLCEEKVINLGLNSTNAICIIGDVGVHSQNIEFIKITDGHPSAVQFLINQQPFDNVFSDLPRFRLVDYNTDGTQDLLVYARNYDLDPLHDAVVDYYRGENGSFVFDKSADTQYN